MKAKLSDKPSEHNSCFFLVVLWKVVSFFFALIIKQSFKRKNKQISINAQCSGYFDLFQWFCIIERVNVCHLRHHFHYIDQYHLVINVSIMSCLYGQHFSCMASLLLYNWRDDLRQFIMLHKNRSLYFIAAKLCSCFSTLCSVLPLIPTRRQHAMNINNSRTFFHDSVQWISFLSNETITYRQLFFL